ncbi:MAG: hypothetical protein NDI94_05355 [Candidatus Woesearchaeota archaeon]|nr:hypothetical protein [Candidatus Woesearchaeota archaeon]
MIEESILISTGVIGALTTYVLNTRLKLGPIRASTIPSFAIGLLFKLFIMELPNGLSNTIPLVFFGASFAGMTSRRIIDSAPWMMASGAIFGTLFVYSSRFFNGYGGGLGIAACLSIVIVIGIRWLLDKISKMLED